MIRPGDEFSDPGTPWLGLTVFALASGPSLGVVARECWDALCWRQETEAIVLAVNSSVKTARLNCVEPDALFFTDLNWYEANADLIGAFPGRVFCVSRGARALCDKIERIENTHRRDFAVGRPPMRDGRSSGHRAVSLAVMLGAKRIVLLGYDMRIDPVSGRSHCHDDYAHTQSDLDYRREFIPSFAGWHADALKVGCEIVNATPGSALSEFPMVDLQEELAA